MVCQGETHTIYRAFSHVLPSEKMYVGWLLTDGAATAVVERKKAPSLVKGLSADQMI
jgi:hypothetical protein